MAAKTGDRVGPRDTERFFTGGMEQFHHPRRVRNGRGKEYAPTPQRQQLLAGLGGRVLEIGAGDGVKLSCYPASVEEIVLVERDPFLQAAARGIATRIATPVQIIDGGLRRLPVADGSCEAVVCSLVLCCAVLCCAVLCCAVLCCAVPVEETLREVRRVLAPGGELRFYEHQCSGNPVVTLAERLVTPIWSRTYGGCHPGRDILAAMEKAGYVIESVDRFAFRHFEHVLGIARPDAG
ncbi:class I SAM-dependent methyltransferase [Nonomuraea basaltis]|uniref:class I SAM-dependent methyltransferase n=1 Tax=Nonomuraea basaltis TaxID=2495887 RepID=UPI00110C64AF|nr:methyltransferase domain-containing protein [Nonomuraea basaltis]TMR89229.1 class I SAM-dependent methyltransferase [Nonomuraea basaltis]